MVTHVGKRKKRRLRGKSKEYETTVIKYYSLGSILSTLYNDAAMSYFVGTVKKILVADKEYYDREYYSSMLARCKTNIEAYVYRTTEVVSSIEEAVVKLAERKLDLGEEPTLEWWVPYEIVRYLHTNKNRTAQERLDLGTWPDEIPR